MELLLAASAAALIAGCLVCAGIGPGRPCDVVTGSVAVTLALVVLLGKALLLLGVFRPVPVTIAAIFCACAAACWLAVSRGAGQRAHATLRTLSAAVSRFRFAPVGCVAAAATVVLVGYEAAMAARLAPVSWDSLYYHLISVAEWVRTGHFVAPLPGLSQHNPSYIYDQADSFPKDAELTASWLAVFTHNTNLVGLAQLPYMPLLFGGVYGICRHLDVRAGRAVVAAAIVTLTPAVVQELGTNYVDVAAAAAVLVAWQFLLSAFPATPNAADATAPKVRGLVLAGIAFGLAAGIKPTDLEYCAAGLAIAFGLCIRDARRLMQAARLAGETEPTLPRTGRCMTAIAVPMLALGSFWYIRSWFVWGSPVWPIQMGPFPGVVTATQWTDVNGLAIPPQLRDSSGLMLLARSWLTPGLSLGASWLYLLLPAIVAATLIAVRRSQLVPVLTVVAPLFLLDVISPGSWQSRFEIPMVAAGAAALALVCEAIAAPAAAARGTAGLLGRSDPGAPPRRRATHRKAAPQSRRAAAIGRRFAPTVLSATALVLAGSTAWTTLNSMSAWQAEPTVRQTLQLLSQPQAVRENIGPWSDYNAMNKALTSPGAVAFFANSAPEFALPLAGMNFRRAVVVLSPYVLPTLDFATPTANLSASAERLAAERVATAEFRAVAAQMRSLGARYLFVAASSMAGVELLAYTPDQLHLVFAIPGGPIFELGGQPGTPAAGAAG
jgi:hypothetical protein